MRLIPVEVNTLVLLKTKKAKSKGYVDKYFKNVGLDVHSRKIIILEDMKNIV